MNPLLLVFKDTKIYKLLKKIGIILIVVFSIMSIVGIVYLLEIALDVDIIDIDAGAYGYNGSYYGKTNGDILKACEEVTNILIKRGCKYQRNGQIKNDIAKQLEEGRFFSCATYVSSVLYYSGALPAEEINKYAYDSCVYFEPNGQKNGVEAMIENNGWKKVKYEDMQAGDILCYPAHVMIYAGDGMVWDQNTAFLSNLNGTKFKYTISRDYGVWRAPSK